MLKLLQNISLVGVTKRPPRVLSCSKSHTRSLADTSGKTTHTSKPIVTQGAGGADENSVRVRRARLADMPRVLQFVREHSHAAWPAFLPSASARASAAQLLLSDYVSRALVQGHSMVAEQTRSRRNWASVRGVALGAAVCPWDAALLERWASCMRCTHSKQLFNFTAHCLRAPNLHDKYNVQKILQVLLLLPADKQNNSELVQKLAKSAIQHGRESGFTVIRFDVCNNDLAKTLEDLKLKKECQVTNEVLRKELGEIDLSEGSGVGRSADKGDLFLAVYTQDLKDTSPASTPAPKTAPASPKQQEAKTPPKTKI